MRFARHEGSDLSLHESLRLQEDEVHEQSNSVHGHIHMRYHVFMSTSFLVTSLLNHGVNFPHRQ